jgi:hypothetical protein
MTRKKLINFSEIIFSTHYDIHISRKRPPDVPLIITIFPEKSKTSKADQAGMTEIMGNFCLESGCSFRFATSTAMKNLIVNVSNFR